MGIVLFYREKKIIFIKVINCIIEYKLSIFIYSKFWVKIWIGVGEG